MKGYLTSKRDFYEGKHNEYKLGTIVASESANPHQLELLSFLITPSFPKGVGAYVDTRAACSLLLTLSNKQVMGLLVLLSMHETYLKSLSNPPVDRSLSPRQVARLIFRAKGEAVDNLLIELLPNNHSLSLGEYEGVTSLLGVSIPSPSMFISSSISTLGSALLVPNEDLLQLGSIAQNGDKAGALLLLGTYWGYSTNSINILRTLIK